MMQINELVASLSEPRAYPFPADRVEVHQTHISAVFLAGPFAYKVKKPVRMGFLDFGTLDRREFFCRQEVRLNRRLAPDVYLGVVPVTGSEAEPVVEGTGDVLEWAVKMQRLPADATLLARLQRGEVDRPAIESLARRVAGFHREAEGGEHVAAFGRFEVVAQNARENFTQAEPCVGRTLSRKVFERLRDLTESALAECRPLIESRAARGVPRDTHGDLHLDHVYLFPDRRPPGDLAVIDCIEFNERFRFADPVADMAFVVMDLRFRGRRDLAPAFADAYFRASEDAEGRALLPFYSAYRAAVRGKVEGFEAGEPEVPPGEAAAALEQARGHWLLALGELETPARRPCLVLVGGLPGSGKSTLARGLASAAHFAVIRSDEVRKELAGVPVGSAAPNTYREGIYRPEITERTYAECLRRAERVLFEGGRVIVDASFGEEQRRQAFLRLADRLAVPALFLHCRASHNVARARLAARTGDASDADWAVYEQVADRWQAPGPDTLGRTRELSLDGTREEGVKQALEALRGLDLGV